MSFDSLVWYTAVWAIVFVQFMTTKNDVIISMNAFKYQYLQVIMADLKVQLMRYVMSNRLYLLLQY